jgi:cobalt/nickel transport system ATP-binding protein
MDSVDGYSGGEKRAVAIASILSMSPDILVMDEPSTGLDPRARRLLIEQLRSFHHTKIIATHDLDLVLDLCDRTIVLHDGRVTADGPTLEIFGNAELLAESHLEKPLRMQGCPVCGGIA